jgi:pyruvate/2-oxoglutarate dehydrogenase complex dihydrolipoamide dehydrogenase (E3) component
MSTERRYDAIIIGAGQAGNPLSQALAGAGWKTALIEQKHVGGTCINEGCTPTKTMIASARVAHRARRSADYGVSTGPITVDLEAVRQRKREIVERFRSANRERLEKTEGLDLLMGQGRFSGPKSVMVNMNDGEVLQLTADTIFINTGARPRVPDLAGLADVPFLDSTSIMELAEAPSHLLVVGGGYVGLEFGQMFWRFDSHVTIVQRRDQVLTHEDPDVAHEVEEILREDGIDILLETHTLQVAQNARDQIELTVDTPEGEQVLTGSHLLIAAGRVPNTEQLLLDTAGVETTSRGHVVVNERLETTAPGIYALGDVKGGPAFTHIAYDDFRVIRANLLEGGDATTEGRLIPYTVFIDPQLGRVGLTEKQARDKGYNIRVAKMPMAHVARAIEVDETRGLMKAVIDVDTRRILGAAVLSIEGGEVMGVIQAAMMGDLPYTALRDTAFAHPTLSESLNNLFMALDA